MESISLPISPDVLHNELESARAIMEKWTQLVSKGIPGVDVPASPEASERFLRELVGELQLVSGRCDTVVEVLSGALV